MTSADRLPEQMHWQDDGCKLFPRCLECPFDVCIYELPGKRATGFIHAMEAQRLHNEGLSVTIIATRMGISSRQVFRALNLARLYMYQTPPQS